MESREVATEAFSRPGVWGRLANLFHHLLRTDYFDLQAMPDSWKRDIGLTDGREPYQDRGLPRDISSATSSSAATSAAITEGRLSFTAVPPIGRVR